MPILSTGPTYPACRRVHPDPVRRTVADFFTELQTAIAPLGPAPQIRIFLAIRDRAQVSLCDLLTDHPDVLTPRT